jgi:hypothetical protein
MLRFCVSQTQLKRNSLVKEVLYQFILLSTIYHHPDFSGPSATITGLLAQQILPRSTQVPISGALLGARPTSETDD